MPTTRHTVRRPEPPAVRAQALRHQSYSRYAVYWPLGRTPGGLGWRRPVHLRHLQPAQALAHTHTAPSQSSGKE